MLDNSTMTLPPVEDALEALQVMGGCLMPDHFVPGYEVDEAKASKRLFADSRGRLYVLRTLRWLEAADLALRSVNRRESQQFV